MSENPAIALCLNYLGRFARTELQLRQYLKRKQCSETDIEQAISYARERGFVQDEQYARSFIESKIAHRDGPLKIKQQLFQKGISPESAGQLIRELYPVELQVDNASALIEKKARYLSAQGGRQKVMRFVASRGFPSYVIIQAFKNRNVSR